MTTRTGIDMPIYRHTYVMHSCNGLKPCQKVQILGSFAILEFLKTLQTPAQQTLEDLKSMILNHDFKSNFA
jgi:hypothetical protein